jgi:hypothetical protein
MSNCDIPILPDVGDLILIFVLVPGLTPARAANIFYPAVGAVKATTAVGDCD